MPGTYNTTMGGFTGVDSLATSTVPLMAIGVMVGVPLILTLIHLFNQNKQFREFMIRIFSIIEDRFIYGVYSWLVAGGLAILYYGSSTSEGQSILTAIAMFIGGILGLVAITTVMGFITKPVWRLIFEFTKKKEVI